MARTFMTNVEHIIITGTLTETMFLEFYYEENICGDIFSKSTSKHLKGSLMKEERLFSKLQLTQEDI